VDVNEAIEEVYQAHATGDQGRLAKALDPVVGTPILAAEVILELLAEKKRLIEAPAMAQVDAVFATVGWPEPSGCGR
jgi:hypothetical protein